jgi:hypothetical protein
MTTFVATARLTCAISIEMLGRHNCLLGCECFTATSKTIRPSKLLGTKNPWHESLARLPPFSHTHIVHRFTLNCVFTVNFLYETVIVLQKYRVINSCGPDGQGIEFRRGQGFPHPSRADLGPTMDAGLQPWRGVDHPLPSSAEVKERVSLFLYSLSGPSWPVLG